MSRQLSQRLNVCYNVVMDKLEYLNQISQSTRPATKSTGFAAFLANNSLILKILIGGLVAFAILIGVGTLINNGNATSADLSKQLYTRIENVNKTVSTYNKSLKSSQLRSITSSLTGTLTGTGAQLKTYLEATYNEEKNPLALPEKLAVSEAEADATLNTALNTAKLNGLLDRVYASQILLQVNLLLSLTSELATRDKDPTLYEILKNFHSNLSTIRQSLDAYSDPSD